MKAFIILSASLLFSLPLLAQKKEGIKANRFELLSGIRKSKDKKTFWDKKYSHLTYVYGKTPAKFLADNYRFIPIGSKVLDMGMGEGRNAVFLARKGYKVVGIDISSVAVKKANMLAREFGVRISTVVASLEKYNFKKGSLDAIICFYYVDRKLHERMVSWLKPGGILIYESHTDLQRNVKGSEHYSREYLLRPTELLGMFKKMRVLKYEEPMHLSSFRASIILKKDISKLK